ncbi:hypothetical protein DSO57_1030036 [Entomophthora muscae]|uniref:Uncharacterized protein n=1 Tax=Entomophthora muscae TaxID=34485 RepID=A0ACC2TCE4_9FUNG|nr:hypothetical protein DSO57_1030036 [Entomophthora muscae]
MAVAHITQEVLNELPWDRALVQLLPTHLWISPLVTEQSSWQVTASKFVTSKQTSVNSPLPVMSRGLGYYRPQGYKQEHDSLYSPIWVPFTAFFPDYWTDKGSATTPTQLLDTGMVIHHIAAYANFLVQPFYGPIFVGREVVLKLASIQRDTSWVGMVVL